MGRNKLTNRTESRASQKPNHIPAEQTRCQQQPSSAWQFTVWCCSTGCLVPALLCSQWDLYRWMASTQSSLEQKTRSPGAELKMIPFRVVQIMGTSIQWMDSGDVGRVGSHYGDSHLSWRTWASCVSAAEGTHTAMSEWPLPSEQGQVKHRELVAHPRSLRPESLTVNSS